ncbi:hypothetical protein J2TS6_34170 [Paenibacillus albilobatus]|uniref:DUF4850 domain-containing protein n=1 Tax=Paenibacillus albilobatus TaxID=2716884 RepID=A0A920CAC7_9BACL|nr:DUF4850 domain-containing protein [Paenibacillus albilobatus]GIO32276.1 hypothetical protein J2TS6_34170 [Paenibacillus albilobatus]
MKRNGITTSGSMRGRLFILTVAVVIILLCTTSLTGPGSMSADEQHGQGQNHQVQDPTPGEGADLGANGAGSGSVNQPATVQCGVLKLDQPGGGIGQIPLYCISGTFYGGFAPPNVPHADLPALRGISLPASESTRWGAFFLNGGSNHGYLLLAPRHWKVVTADIGMNGSVKIELQDPSDPLIRATYSDTGSCGGCATQMIGSYFPDMRAWAEEQGMTPDALTFDKQSVVNDHIVQYRLHKDAAAYRTYGAAYRFQGKDDNRFTMLEVEAPEPRLKDVGSMLDFFAKYPTALVY